MKQWTDSTKAYFSLIYKNSVLYSATATERTRQRRRRGKISVNLLRLVWEFRKEVEEREGARGKGNIMFFTRGKLVREKEKGYFDLKKGAHV